ncbi:phenylalanyl-tRNA synthetase subunit beta [Maribius pontilimi]|uniref:Phenylalanyl-tRNA synthetase subunit beta n=1 Tax=Palleronia pontilimi TaxID=1964209 RepID=A0A934MAV2_9RHOB|nr:phenylalanyl-tRNA synthetase subunit beta [Palleronia pontilimi]MBJ3764042.1 phenylalanyl-tRNA synthetase subunit beta [Palleronia pontilimi]
MWIVKAVFVACTVLLVLGGTVALWLSDWPLDSKVKLTLLNSLGWAVILLPALAVSKWARAHAPDRDPQD